MVIQEFVTDDFSLQSGSIGGGICRLTCAGIGEVVAVAVADQGRTISCLRHASLPCIYKAPRLNCLAREYDHHVSVLLLAYANYPLRLHPLEKDDNCFDKRDGCKISLKPRLIRLTTVARLYQKTSFPPGDHPHRYHWIIHIDITT